jgi:hypothetical protein
VYAGLYLPDLKGEDFDRAVQFGHHPVGAAGRKSHRGAGL